MLLNQKVERESTIPGRVTKLMTRRKVDGGQEGYVWNPRFTGCLSDLPCPVMTVSGKLGNPSNLRPVRTCIAQE